MFVKSIFCFHYYMGTVRGTSNSGEYLSGGEEGLLEEIQVGVDKVKKPLVKLRDDKAPGLDNMHPRVLWEVVDQVSVVIADIFNSSLESDKIPENLRVANVTLLFLKERFQRRIGER